MNQMNQVLIEGNVVRDTVVKETPRGTRVCTVPIATNRFYRDSKGEFQKEVAYFNVEAWGENFCKTVVRMAKKGRGLRVVGRLKQDRWKTQDGKNSSRIFIIAEHIEFQPERNAAAAGNSGSQNQYDGKNAAMSAAEGVAAETEAFPDEDFSDGGEAVF